MNNLSRNNNSLNHVERPKISRAEERKHGKPSKKKKNGKLKWIIFIIVIILVIVGVAIPLVHDRLSSSNSTDHFFKSSKVETTKSKRNAADNKQKKTTNTQTKPVQQKKQTEQQKQAQQKKQTEQQKQVNNTYTVKAGDTLGTIAKKYNTSVEQLEKLNNLVDDGLNAGQVIKVK